MKKEAIFSCDRLYNNSSEYESNFKSFFTRIEPYKHQNV